METVQTNFKLTLENNAEVKHIFKYNIKWRAFLNLNKKIALLIYSRIHIIHRFVGFSKYTNLSKVQSMYRKI